MTGAKRSAHPTAVVVINQSAIDQSAIDQSALEQSETPGATTILQAAVAPVPLTSTAVPYRWIAVGVFVIASLLNYLDRQLLAALAPALRTQFHLTNADYGAIIGSFSLIYAIMTPLAGLFADAAGLTVGISLSIGVWSLAGAATGLTSSLRGLLGCRSVLGLAEAAGLPCASKANATYLEPRELGLGTGVHSLGFLVGSLLAPLLVAAMAPRYGWRSVFFVTGALGLLWIPLWQFTSRKIPARPVAKAAAVPLGRTLRDKRLWSIAIASALIMTVFTLWSNWTTLYFVQARGLTMIDANLHYAWIPPIFATAGGVCGGLFAFLVIRRGNNPARSRLRICQIGTPLLLVTAAVPFLSSNFGVTAAISMSFFVCMMVLTNLHTIPTDLFGPGRAAFTASVMASSFALMQTFVSPVIGAMVDHYGFQAVCVTTAFMPLIGLVILWPTLRDFTPAE